MQSPTDEAHPISRRGFAAMDPERRREIAKRGGASVPSEKRSFAQNRDLAANAGRKGGAPRAAAAAGPRPPRVQVAGFRRKMANSGAGLVQCSAADQPARRASASNPSSVYLYEFSVWIVSPG